MSLREQEFVLNQRELITSTRLRGGDHRESIDPPNESDASTIREREQEFHYADPTYSETPYATLRGDSIRPEESDDESSILSDDSPASRLNFLKLSVEQFLQISESSEGWREVYGDQFKNISKDLNILNRECLQSDKIDVIREADKLFDALKNHYDELSKIASEPCLSGAPGRFPDGDSEFMPDFDGFSTLNNDIAIPLHAFLQSTLTLHVSIYIFT